MVIFVDKLKIPLSAANTTSAKVAMYPSPLETGKQ
jgi:hypothetical protein